MLIFPSNLLRSPRLHLYSHRNPIFLEVRMHFRKQVSQWEGPEQHVTRSPLTPHSPVPGCRAPVHRWRRGAWAKPASRPQLGSPAATPTGLPVCVTQRPHSREDSTVWGWISRICQILRWEGPLTWPFVCVLAGDLWSPHSALASLSRSLPNKCLPARHEVSVPTWLVPGDVTLELCPHSGQHQDEGQGSPHFPQWVLCHPHGYTDLLTKVLAWERTTTQHWMSKRMLIHIFYRIKWFFRGGENYVENG